MMNNIKLDVYAYTANNKYEADGIIFTDTAIIKVFIDEKDLHDVHDFADALINFPELLHSIEGSGKYLIITCACGVADDGGWDYVEVIHKNNQIKWVFNVNDREISYNFEQYNYDREILRIKKEIKLLDSKIIVEPQHVIFPE